MSRAGQGRTARAAGLVALLSFVVGVPAPAHAEVNSIVVTTLADSGPGSLRAALAQAQVSAADDLVTFAPSVTGTVELTSGELEAVVGGGSGDLTVEGPGRDLLAVDAGGRSRVLHVRGPGGDTRPSVVVSGLSLTEGYGDGGAVRALATDLTLDRVLIADSEARNGGGVLVHGGSLLVTGSTITGNLAFGSAYEDGGYGGGISFDGGEAEGATLVVRNSTISGNHADRSGGGIHGAGQSPVEIVASTVRDNSSSGAFLLAPEAVEFTGSGGGVSAGRLDVVDSKIMGNTARHGGGVTGDSVTVSGSTIAGNVTKGDGGGIAAAEVRLQSSTLTGNRAESGGGIHVDGEHLLEVALSTVAGNTAVVGGGIYSMADVALRGSIVAMNSGGDLAGTGGATLERSLVQDPRDFPYVDAGGSVVGQDPLLGPLGEHGGPTPTRVPASNSPVIDRGSAFGEVGDQRGLPRPVDDPAVPDADDGSDIGAVELTGSEQAGPPQVASTAPPVITGTVRVGETLHTDGGTWAPADVSLAYQWLRNGQPIPGATAASYTLTADDYGEVTYAGDARKRLSVLVTAAADGHREGSAFSDHTDKVGEGLLETTRRAEVTGRPRVGSTLRARPRRGGVAPRPRSVFIAWFLDDRRVRHAADERRLTLTRRMRGKRVSVRFDYDPPEGYAPLRQVVEKRRRVRR